MVISDDQVTNCPLLPTYICPLVVHLTTVAAPSDIYRKYLWRSVELSLKLPPFPPLSEYHGPARMPPTTTSTPIIARIKPTLEPPSLFLLLLKLKSQRIAEGFLYRFLSRDTSQSVSQHEGDRARNIRLGSVGLYGRVGTSPGSSSPSPQSSSQQPWHQPGLEPLTFSRSHLLHLLHLLSLHPSQGNTILLQQILRTAPGHARKRPLMKLRIVCTPSCHTGSTFFSDGMVFAGLAGKTVYAPSVQWPTM